ncbi:MAG TPA: hypothetical protein VFR78_04725 [Pyrinomonadaceae bacterium]|nr:hypothetical protein [Pyrinomonadaceae bacterium]
MYCPQCGTESLSTQYCRVCGANLKVIGKAVALSEAVARSDRGPLPKIKEMVRNLKVDDVSDEVSGALEKMNQEIAAISPEKEPRALISFGKKKTPAEKREGHISKGVVSLFSGIGLTIFLYYLSAALVLKLPPDVVAAIPFEIDPVVRIIWLLGLLPATSGVGHIIAGLLIRPQPLPEKSLNEPYAPPHELRPPPHASVTERTTNLL